MGEILTYRMYGMVPYNMSPIQQGIQFGHAVVDYAQTVKGIKPAESIYDKWAKNDKTFIILNGGTTNTNPERFGTLNQHLITLRENGVLVQDFYEPDLGDQLTAIVFLVDERVFDKDLYPDFLEEMEPWDINEENVAIWVEKIGGSTNDFLREFLPKFRLA